MRPAVVVEVAELGEHSVEFAEARGGVVCTQPTFEGLPEALDLAACLRLSG
jgi:hypothetical protein